MDHGNRQQSGLAAVLQALAALTPESAEQSRYHAPQENFISQVSSNLQSESPLRSVPSQVPHPDVSQILSSLIIPPVTRPSAQHRIELPAQDRLEGLHPTRSSAASSLVDPSSIIDWTSGLRYVSKLAAQDPNFAGSIQKMILNQQQHEKLWWSNRVALVKQQLARVEGVQKIQNVLSIGGDVPVRAAAPSAEQHQEELKAYDTKVYKASQELVTSMSADLRVLRVPFFAVRPDFILSQEQIKTHQTDTSQRDDQKVSEKELIALQRRMLQYLEDMYKP